jgi:hypothetical protein
VAQGRRLVNPTSDECLAQRPDFQRTCGLASTYNNAGCRGEACRHAASAVRMARRESRPSAVGRPMFLEPSYTTEEPR